MALHFQLTIQPCTKHPTDLDIQALLIELAADEHGWLSTIGETQVIRDDKNCVIGHWSTTDPQDAPAALPESCEAVAASNVESAAPVVVPIVKVPWSPSSPNHRNPWPTTAAAS